MRRNDDADHRTQNSHLRQQIGANEPGSTDPVTGLFVFTAAWLRSVGECSDRGCRHCPYVE